MNISIIQHGLAALIPSLTVTIVLSAIGISLFLTGRATALRHLVKYHLKDIADDEVHKMLAENTELHAEIKRLKNENEVYLKTLSGIRYLLKKEQL